MPEVATLSATGEVKIPLKTRTALSLRAGQKFEVQVRGKDILFVQLGLPSTEAVKEFVAWKDANPTPGPTRIGPRRSTNGDHAVNGKKKARVGARTR